MNVLEDDSSPSVNRERSCFYARHCAAAAAGGISSVLDTTESSFQEAIKHAFTLYIIDMTKVFSILCDAFTRLDHKSDRTYGQCSISSF